MSLKKKLIISAFVLVCIVVLKLNPIQALTQDEAGKYIAEFSINYYNDYGDQTTYSWDFAQRAAACRGEKTSGMAGAPTPYYFENYYAVDCVGWVSMAIYQSLKIDYPGINDTGYTGYVVPTKYANNYKTDIMEDVTGQELKPGDILANSHHVMVYVGNNRIVHSVSRFHLNYDTFESYAAMNSTSGSDTRGVYTKVYRIKESAAKKIKKSDATTIFKGSGGVTNKWSDSGSTSISSSTEPYQNGRIVSTDDKLPLFKHILLTEKYNFNNIKWKRYGHGYDGENCETQEDLNLGLKYPVDESNTSLDNFIDFTLPYIQTWLIPLSMNAGALTQGSSTDSEKNPLFTYSIIKDAMSDIIVNRYDITTCTLTTKYRLYDVIQVTETYQPIFGEDGSITSLVLIRTDESTIESGVKEPEEDVNKKVDIEPTYYVKQALTYDKKITNEFNYIKYSDEDVKNKVDNGVGFVGKTEEEGEAINEKGKVSTGTSGGYVTISYQKKVGNYIYVYRTWRDELEVKENKTESYNLDDVKSYNAQSDNDSDISNSSVATDLNGADQTSTYNGKTIRYSAKFASQTKTPEELGLKYEKITNGETTNYDGCRVCNENVAQIGCTGIKLELGRKIVARWTKDSFVDYGDWVYIEGWGYALVADCGGFTGKASDKYHLDCFVGQEGDVIDDGKGDYSALKRRCINWKGVYERKPGSQTGVTIYRIKAEDIPEELLTGDVETIDSSDTSGTSSNSNSSSASFTQADEDYYNILKLDDAINRVDIINSKPANYSQYLKKGTEYLPHVGYSRAQLTFSYSTLRRLFDDYYGATKKVPFAYGSSLGYATYTGNNEMKSGSYNLSNISLGGSTVIGGNIETIPGAVQVPAGLGKSHSWTIWNHVNEQYNPESTWPADSPQGKLILHLTDNNERSLHGELAGNITANSKRMVCYGEWLASAMVAELGGTQGNPEKKLQVGDFVFIIQDNGTFYPVILTDTKVQFNTTYYDPNPANEWGHDNGQSMVEFQGHTSSWRDVPATPEDFNHYIKQVYVVGNVYSSPEYLNNIVKAAEDVGLNPENLINPKNM